jgi:hypothetical protein
MDIQEFRSLVADFLQTSNMSPTQFGVKALNDPGFVFGILKGKRECRSATVGKVVEFMANNTQEKKLKKKLSRLCPING